MLISLVYTVHLILIDFYMYIENRTLITLDINYNYNMFII